MPATSYYAASDVGLHRHNNEDAILSNPDQGLWLVADGMGGHDAGEVASAITSATIQSTIERGESLEQAIRCAHRAVLKAAADGVGKRGMGSTVVALKNCGRSYQIGWVGDSRAYLWSPRNNRGVLQQLTTDHSYVQMLYQSGLISADEMAAHPEKNVITQCLGSVTSQELTVDIVERKWSSGDRVLLCSDGLTDTVNDQAICEIISRHDNVETAVHDLVQAALKNGGKDNISAILVAAPSGIGSSIRAGIGRFAGRLRSRKDTD